MQGSSLIFWFFCAWTVGAGVDAGRSCAIRGCFYQKSEERGGRRKNWILKDAFANDAVRLPAASDIICAGDGIRGFAFQASTVTGPGEPLR